MWKSLQQQLQTKVNLFKKDLAAALPQFLHALNSNRKILK
jgi:hypothetical protein